jgi:hypothetical protein
MEPNLQLRAFRQLRHGGQQREEVLEVFSLCCPVERLIAVRACVGNPYRLLGQLVQQTRPAVTARELHTQQIFRLDE